MDQCVGGRLDRCCEVAGRSLEQACCFGSVEGWMWVVLVWAACAPAGTDDELSCVRETVLPVDPVTSTDGAVTAVFDEGWGLQDGWLLVHGPDGEPGFVEPANYNGVARSPMGAPGPVTVHYEAQLPDWELEWEHHLVTFYGVAPGEVIRIAEVPADTRAPELGRRILVHVPRPPERGAQVVVSVGCGAHSEAPTVRQPLQLRLDVPPNCISNDRVWLEARVYDPDQQLIGVSARAGALTMPSTTSDVRLPPWDLDPPHLALTGPGLAPGWHARWSVTPMRCGRAYPAASRDGGSLPSGLEVGPAGWADDVWVHYLQTGSLTEKWPRARTAVWRRAPGDAVALTIAPEDVLPALGGTFELRDDRIHVQLEPELLPPDALLDVRIRFRLGGEWRHVVAASTSEFTTPRLPDGIRARLGRPLAGAVVVRRVAGVADEIALRQHYLPDLPLLDSGDLRAESWGRLEWVSQ